MSRVYLYAVTEKDGTKHFHSTTDYYELPACGGKTAFEKTLSAYYADWQYLGSILMLMTEKDGEVAMSLKDGQALGTKRKELIATKGYMEVHTTFYHGKAVDCLQLPYLWAQEDAEKVQA